MTDTQLMPLVVTDASNYYEWRSQHEKELLDNQELVAGALAKADNRLNGIESPLSSNFKTGSAQAEITVRYWQLWCVQCQAFFGPAFNHRKTAINVLADYSNLDNECDTSHTAVIKTWTRKEIGLLSGVSVNFSILKTCSPTNQCSGCYASDPKALMTWDRSIMAYYANTLAVNTNPVLFGQRVAQWVAKPNTRRRLECVTGDYALRWFGSGDLTPASINAIISYLQATDDWLTKYGRRSVAAVFSRKPHMINRLIDKARQAGVLGRIAINMSLDGSDVGESIDRYRVVYDADNAQHIRVVQYVNVDDFVFANAATVFPDHDTKQLIDNDARDCPAIRTDSINCMDCGACFEPTMKGAL